MFSRKLTNSIDEMVELIEHFEEVPDRAGHPVEGPDQHHIEAVPAGVGQQLIETGALGLAPEMVSVYSRTISKPRCAAIWRRS